MNYKNSLLSLKTYSKHFYKKSMFDKSFQLLVASSASLLLLALFFSFMVNFFGVAIAAISIVLILDKIFGFKVTRNDFIY